MIKKIVFFNHFHRGDLFTSKEFVAQMVNLWQHIPMEYWHYNHPKTIGDLSIPLTGIPQNLNRNYHILLDSNSETLFVNTWIGAHGEIFSKHGGVNLLSLTESWASIFESCNKVINDNSVPQLEIYNTDFYIPTINYSHFDIRNVEEFVRERTAPRVLVCNGVPMSNQSFVSNMSIEIEALSYKYKNVDFICTSNFETSANNIFFTDDIIKDTATYHLNVPWHDRQQNTCDVNEIAALSRHCSLIVGKNSGPFVFCENRDNFMDPTKSIISFSKGHKESMSNGIKVKCKYNLVTNHSPENIMSVLDKEISLL